MLPLRKLVLVLGSIVALSGCGNTRVSSLAIAEEAAPTINLGALPPSPDREFVNLVSVSIKPELLEEFLSVLLPYAALSRQEEGVLRYDIHQSPHDPTVIELYEVYRDTEARMFHNNAPHRNAFFAKVAERQYFRVPAVAKVVHLIDPLPSTP